MFEPQKSLDFGRSALCSNQTPITLLLGSDLLAAAPRVEDLIDEACQAIGQLISRRAGVVGRGRGRVLARVGDLALPNPGLNHEGSLRLEPLMTASSLSLRHR